MRPFREHHLYLLLKEFDPQRGPFDRYLFEYFRANRALGSKDRRAITELAYTFLRWRGLIDTFCPKPVTWEERIDCLMDGRWEAGKSDASLPGHVRVSFRKELFQLLVASYGEKKALEIGFHSNTPAPLTIRVNPLKTTREALLTQWQGRYQMEPCERSELGIRFLEREQLGKTDEFREGLFEIQDEGSQCLAALVEAKPGQRVLDFCAGSGGKSLAIAPALVGKGQLYLHDIRLDALSEAKRRLRRAGVENAQIVPPESEALKRLKQKMDWVLVDAPCSGTGTLRRNPDMKWRFNEAFLRELIGKQRNIFERALSYVKPGGKIVYATCSVLAEENEQQAAHFLDHYPVLQEGEAFKSLPEPGGWDGFYGAIFSKK